MDLQPARTWTFLFTDIEGSTRLWERDRAAMQHALERHDRLLRQAIEAHQGRVFKTVGDAFCAIFDDAHSALSAAADGQRALFAADWSMLGEAEGLRVRMGLHTGTAVERDGDFFGPAVNRSARIEAAANGGQLLISAATLAELETGEAPFGLSYRDLGEHRLKDLRHAERLTQVLIEGLPEVTRALRTVGELDAGDRILVVDPAAGAGEDLARDGSEMLLDRTVEETRAALLDVLRGATRSLILTPEQVRAVARSQPADLQAYRLGRVAEWSQPQFRVDGRFVGLTLLIDKGEDALMGRWQPSPEAHVDLGALMATIEDPAVVLLGPPGSGKSTLLRRFELDRAVEALRGEPEARLSFFVPLNQFAGGDPGVWLEDRWRRRSPDLPELAELLAAGQMTLLLDALNEMPAADERELDDWTRRWRRWLQGFAADARGNRVIFSCRSLDYSQPLSSPELRVPQVRIEPLVDAQVQDFLRLHSPLRWREIWQSLEGSPQLVLLRSPYFLSLLVTQVEATGDMPAGRAALFTGLIRQALRREVERGNVLFDDGRLLHGRDRRQITRWQWQQDTDLPDRGPLVPLLGKLAFEMQQSRPDGERAQARIAFDDALDILDTEVDEAIVQAGTALAVLDEDLVTDELMYMHQLLQEFFAARVLAKTPDPGLVRQAWKSGEVRPPIDLLLSQIAPADPLPPMPSTGWEETSILAAAISTEPEAFVEGMIASNLALAGRAAAQPGLASRLPAALRSKLRAALLERSHHPDADLRARIAAARALGALGDPRLRPGEGRGGRFLLPEFAAIPAGDYPIGLSEPIVFVGGHSEAHMPAHQTRLEPFWLASRPVTNAEWACFQAAGGYDEPRYWKGEAAEAWRRGESTADGIRAGQRYWLGRFLAEPDLLTKLLEQGTIRPGDHERWLLRLSMADIELEQHLRETYPGQRFTAPRTWTDPRYNHASQPVVGVCWYEAGAYCSWLAEESGLPLRLASEVEWEAAARGIEGRAYAYGDRFDPWRANTHETHLRATAPVGVFPAGDTPEGLQDMTGNVYEWTSSAFGRDRGLPEYGYPYRADDGRELVERPNEVLVVTRGGAWASVQATAHAAFRGPLAPSERNNQGGFRLASSIDPASY